MTKSEKNLDYDASMIRFLPSGTEIPVQFSNGERTILVVGRDKMHTYLITNYLGKNYMNPIWSNYGGWPDCSMRKHVQKFYEMLPEYLKKLVIPMHIRQYPWYGFVECDDMAFLLSATNVFGDEAWPLDLTLSKDVDDTQIDIFSERNNRIKYLNGKEVEWSLRSPYYIESFCSVYKDGSLHAVKAGREYGIVVAFCIENR